MILEIRDRHGARRIDQHELVLERSRLAEMNGPHAHREINPLLGRDLPGSRQKRGFVLGKDQQVLLGPHHQPGARPRLSAAALEEPVVQLRQLRVDRGPVGRGDLSFGDSRHFSGDEEVARPIDDGGAQRRPLR